MKEPTFNIIKCLDYLEKHNKHETRGTLLLIHYPWMRKCADKTEKEIKEIGLMTRKEFMK